MKKVIFYSLILTLLASLAQVSFAATSGSYTLLEPLPCVGRAGTAESGQTVCLDNNTITEITINQYIGYVFKFAIALAVFLAVVMIIWGGFEYMISEIPSVKVDAKGRITNAIYGLVITLASYLILQTIDPRLVQINTTIEPVHLATTDATAFIGQLDKDLATLNEQDRARVNTLKTEIADIQKSIDGLEQKKKELGLSPEEELNLERFKDGVKSREADVISTGARGDSVVSFAKALAKLHDYSSFYTPSFFRHVPGSHEPGELTDDAIIEQKKYDLEIKSLNEAAKKLDDLGQHDKASRLRVREQTYIDQIKEEKELMTNILSYQSYSGAEKASAASKLNDALKVYSQPEVAVSNPKADTELAKEYATLKQQRVALINQTLEAKK